MPRLDVLPFGIAHHMALIPLLWLAWLRFKGRDPDIAWWLIAWAFFVSWITDSIAHFVSAPMMSVVYPVMQSALVLFVFLSRNDALKVVGVLTVIGVFDVFFFGVDHPDILLRTVAWLSVVGIVWSLWQLGKLRTSLLIYFGAGLLCWWAYALWPGWTFWTAYQLTRLAGILLFCVAALHPMPQLKLYRK